MAGDLLPALDPLLDPRSPAAQAVLNRTSYSVRGRVGTRVGAFFAPVPVRPAASAQPRCWFRAAPTRRASSDQAGGSAPSPLPSRRHSQGCTTSTDPASLAFRRALAGEWRGLRPSCTLRAPT